MQKAYWRNFTKDLSNKLGIKLKMLAFSEGDRYRFVDIQGPQGIVRLIMQWHTDGSSNKPATEMLTYIEATQVGEQDALFENNFNVGRFAIWGNPAEYADDWVRILRRESRDDGFMPFGVLTPSSTDEDDE
jgi:hypothetical protein